MTQFRPGPTFYLSPDHAIEAPPEGIDGHPSYLTPRKSPIDTLVAL